MGKALDAVLFDVGGVLVEVSGVDRLRGWTDPGYSDEEVWKLWLESSSVRAFESGQVGPDEFADRLIDELNLPVGAEELLFEFVRWIPAPFPGARALLDSLAGVRRATLSNSNPLHWPRITGEMGLGECFDLHFVSHLTGRMKPDPEAFEHALAGLGTRAAEVLYIDDTQTNVDAARKVGIRAERARGVTGARSVLENYGLLGEPGGGGPHV
jgi:putative hydrolase of the HAD superfamily